MALEYLREYRTYFHISRSYGISESACYRNIRWIEDTLIKDGTFSLPGRKALLKSDVEYEVVLIDATESPIERPKKNKSTSIPEKEKTHVKDTNYCRQKTKENYLHKFFRMVSGMILDYLRSQVFAFTQQLKVLPTQVIKKYIKLHQNSALPKKKTKKNSLTKEDKKKNR